MVHQVSEEHGKFQVPTLVSVTLGHSDDVDHLVLSEHLANLDLLLEVLTGEGNLKRYS